MSTESDVHEYDVVVGGGPAGMTAALDSTRLGHETSVVTRGVDRMPVVLWLYHPAATDAIPADATPLRSNTGETMSVTRD